MDQTEKPKGRGRGRGRSNAPPKRPNPEAVAKVEASEPADPQPKPETGQFDDAPGEVPSSTPPSTQAANPKPSVEKESTPPLVKELKAAVKQGPKVGDASILDPQSPEFLLSSNGKAPPFPVMNGPSSGIGSDSAPTRPIISKLQPLSTSQLNVRAAEFVPSVPLENSQQDSTEPTPSEPPPEDGLPSSPTDIIAGFRPVVKVKGLESEPIMKAAAEMLVKGTLYVGSFERLQIKLVTTLQAFPPSDDVYQNLAEMLIYWGVMEPFFCYTSCKICETLSAEHKFRNALVHRMQNWYKKESATLNTSQTIGIINYSLFFAELFTRLRIGEQPIEILASNIFNLVRMLLDLKTNETVIGACNILKLTGILLEQCEKTKNTEKMSKVIELLRELTADEDNSLSRSCIELLTLVIELHAREWGEKKGVPKLSVPSIQPPPVTEAKAKLNVDAAPFVPTSFQIEQPVMNVADWNQFETDYSELEEDVEGVEYDCPDGDDGLDPDIELEMEAFIDAIEEHLLMQDFDPELREQK